MPKGGSEESREEAALIGALYSQHQNALNIAWMAQASEAYAAEAREWAAKLETNVANQEDGAHPRFHWIVSLDRV
jgi:hypothetical protein